ncbi:hypothetical protein F444_07654 [Phytophthora nicotianae P1976]|uniref:Uncharacterized protein n=1 Tax=Phytophthora nicotianae P1976 TaxID=1317066 RepID=A0A081ADZ5_PHYNI|nr:hypothetical protein F444_07654 [Phytophthora nicotianae P1976]
MKSKPKWTMARRPQRLYEQQLHDAMRQQRAELQLLLLDGRNENEQQWRARTEPTTRVADLWEDDDDGGGIELDSTSWSTICTPPKTKDTDGVVTEADGP